MQYSFTLRFALEQAPSKQLLRFIQPSEANIVLPTDTLGGNLIIKGKSSHRLTLHLPLLEKKVSFPIAFEDQTHWYKPSIYNLACVFSSFLIIHSIDMEENQFVIQLITSNQQHYDLVNTIYQFFSKE